MVDIFNLRDLSNVFQGILGAETSYLDSNVHVARLWVHECLRVFSDRLIDDTDKQWVLAQMTDMILPTTFQLKWHTVLAQQIPNRTTVTGGGDGGEDAVDAVDAADAAAPPLMFGSFTNPQAFTAMEQKYEDLGGLGHRPLMALVQSYLTDYNLSRADGGMNLVLFMYCVEHVVRVCRVLRQPGGNALLVGVGVRAIYCMYIYDTFLMPVGCTRCVTSSTCTDNTMNIQARITLNVECRRGGIFICVFDV